MPIGHTNAPYILINTMNNLFSKILDFGVAVLLDNILIYSTMVKEKFKNLE